MPEQTRKSARDELCAHEGCSCRVTAATAFTSQGDRYCSQGCMDGEGCDHDGCNCAEDDEGSL